MLRFLLGALCVVAVGCGTSSKPSGGQEKSEASLPVGIAPKTGYPTPKTRYKGATADQWARLAEDADEGTARQGAIALRELQEEGTPFLLRLIESRQRNSLMALAHLDGKFVHAADLVVVSPYVATIDDKNTGPLWLSTWVLLRSGSKAKQFLPHLKNLAELQRSKIAPLKQRADLLKIEVQKLARTENDNDLPKWRKDKQELEEVEKALEPMEKLLDQLNNTISAIEK
jgi:hypothetical protein